MNDGMGNSVGFSNNLLGPFSGDFLILLNCHPARGSQRALPPRRRRRGEPRGLGRARQAQGGVGGGEEGERGAREERREAEGGPGTGGRLQGRLTGFYTGTLPCLKLIFTCGEAEQVYQSQYFLLPVVHFLVVLYLLTTTQKKPPKGLGGQIWLINGLVLTQNPFLPLYDCFLGLLVS